MLLIADEVAEAFKLGEPLDSSPVPGGLSNDLWRLETDTGTFAVKVMRANASNPDFRGNIEAAYAIEGNASNGVSSARSPSAWTTSAAWPRCPVN